MKTKRLVLLLVALVVLPGFAAPASWYKWRSKLTGKTVCAQVMQGEWVIAAGPFKDARCKRPGIPG